MLENENNQVPVQEEIKLSDYFRIILQHRYLEILVFFLVIVPTVLYTARLPKVYSALPEFYWKMPINNLILCFYLLAD
jgi:uncharacterized protein involved in exopolysaccharide biosynthesis